jgi:outer membrane lipoprotein-sorting protein
MPFRRVPVALFLLCLMVYGFSSCLARRRLITRKGGSTAQNLLIADRNTLLQAITRQYEAIHDFNATVDMVPALGTAEKSKITEYKDVRAYILFRGPADIRIIGLFPVVRNKAWDMLSNGTDFKLYLPSQNRFIVGRNEIEQPSKNKLENLRPQHFLEALIVKPVDPAVDKVLLENFTDEDNAYYILHIVRENGGRQLQLMRTIWFDRLKLQLARQMVFDTAGNILTDARYADWRAYDNTPFPKHVEINRPRDEYAVVIDIVKMDINKGITDDKFVLDRPEGSTLQTIGAPTGAATPEAPRK